MATKKKTELTVAQDFHFRSRWDGVDEETMAEIREELESLGDNAGIACRKIKVPSGGGLAYEVEGEDKDDVEYKKEIEAVSSSSAAYGETVRVRINRRMMRPIQAMNQPEKPSR